MERPARQITIRELELLEPAPTGDLRLRIRCSKGTYVRTLCHDIGQALGLRRCYDQPAPHHGLQFTLEQAVPLKQLSSCATPSAFSSPHRIPVSRLSKTVLSPAAEKKCVTAPQLSCCGLPSGDYRAYSQSGAFWPQPQRRNNPTTIKSFFQVEMQQSR